MKKILTIMALIIFLSPLISEAYTSVRSSSFSRSAYSRPSISRSSYSKSSISRSSYSKTRTIYIHNTTPTQSTTSSFLPVFWWAVAWSVVWWMINDWISWVSENTSTWNTINNITDNNPIDMLSIFLYSLMWVIIITFLIYFFKNK
jgi:hypothetical protein